ncbi:MAG: TAT-variant-translocated molybdopterin oxidoreductase [bacterium]|nr:TAT-variant-translocated molybdopterin oxidoreductase [bacterium]
MGRQGKEYWRSLNQLADTDEFKEFLHREFPKGTVELAGNAWSRRSFLTTMGASLALAGLAGCRRPVEKIVPYVTRPEEIQPGLPNRYATTMPLGGSACGLVVTSREGRPVKIEGNELHPSSQGAAGTFMQASILGLYDPDRSQEVLKDGRSSDWDAFVAFWKKQQVWHIADGGEGLAVLSESFSSPSLSRLKTQFEKAYPRAKWVSYDPVSDGNISLGIEAATGRKLQPVYDYSKAKVVLSLDSDFLGFESESVKATLGFADGRRVLSQQDDMSRLYVVETALSITGSTADHRLAIEGGRIAAFARALAGELSRQGVLLNVLDNVTLPDGSDFDGKWLEVAAADLIAAGRQSLIVVGRRQPAEVHALVLALNEALGNIGETVSYNENSDSPDSNRETLAELTADMREGRVSTLIYLGGNPVYNAPVDLEFASSLRKVKTIIHFGLYADESAAGANWHVPQAHFLESWGDARAVDGTTSVIQPLIEPLYGAHTDLEFASLLTSGETKSAHDAVKDTWKDILGGGDFDKKWRRVLHDGLLTGSAAANVIPRIDRRGLTGIISASTVEKSKVTVSNMEIGFYSSNVFDGRFANNGWLQELPDAVTKIAWDNVALVSPATAEELKVENGDMVTLNYEGRSLEMPVWISPGQAKYTVAVALGYGRTAAGRVGTNTGFDTYRLRTAGAPYFASGLTVGNIGNNYTLANTQDHGSMEGRPIVRENTLAGYKDKVEFFPEEPHHPPLVALWDEVKYDKGYQWGMSIDLNACTGCGACVIACQSENNIPIVGKEQVHNGREMHWVRLDRYYAGDKENPEVVMQPMTCQQCENAPCEQVCPVAATTHDDEGLNVMVYNRCIGTRYCSNNCPYKVRRFNFFNYTNDIPEVAKMAQNPEVTVRFRGVMEKCTYCIQRINTAKIDSRSKGREVADGEIVTACQQSCPAKAIVFGNINDPESEVSKLKENNRKYHVLEEINTRPRTSYMARLRNPNPALVSKESHKSEHENG